MATAFLLCVVFVILGLAAVVAWARWEDDE